MKRRKVLKEVIIEGFQESIDNMSESSRIFVDKSFSIMNRIHAALERSNMTQKELADKMGKSEAEVCKLLNGHHNYTIRMLAKIEAATGESIISVSF